MIYQKHRIYALLILLTSLIFLQGCTNTPKTATYKTPFMTYEVNIYDEDFIIEDESEEVLAETLSNFQKKNGIQVIVLTIPAYVPKAEVERYSNIVWEDLESSTYGTGLTIMTTFYRSGNIANVRLGKNIETAYISKEEANEILQEHFYIYATTDIMAYNTAITETVQSLVTALSMKL